MDVKPSAAKTLDYGLRWGIESMFSDFKTRGFEITKTQLKTAEPIERLILILGVAMLFAVLVGKLPQTPNPSKNNYVH